MSTSNAILIIDDEPFLRSTLAVILRRVGYTTGEAGDAQEALKILSDRHFDLIFLDLQMPDRDGLALLPELLSLRPGIPVLILTANGSLEKAVEALRLGARDYLLKPIEPGQIITRVDDILKEKVKAATAEPSNQIIGLGPYALDLKQRKIRLDDKTVPLPTCTFEYLAVLAHHAPEPVSYQDLVAEAQGYKLTKVEAQDLARWRIYRLRKILEADPREPVYILSIPGFGYRLALQ
jgi:two-component system, OmpR family, phosphate regulon response regulator OmpR